MQNDFDYGMVDDTAHRPWPLPRAPWLMTQSWHDLAFAHWSVDEQQLRDAIPAGIELDIFEGQFWIGVVPFRMTNVAPRGVPALPFVSTFNELNVRTYVVAEGKPGVYFFSLDAGNPVAVGFARSLLHLPYHSAAMRCEARDGWIQYESRRIGAPAAAFTARYRGTGPIVQPADGSLEHFLTERYCLYTLGAANVMRRLDIHHRRWPLQRGEMEITANTMIDPTGVRLPDMAPLVHFCSRQDMVAWAPSRVG